MKSLRFAMVLAALAAVVFVSGGAIAAERSAVPEKYQWNTADLFPTADAWEKARADLAARIPTLAQHQGKLNDAAGFKQALQAMFAIDQDLRRVEVYAQMVRDEDQRVGPARERAQAAAALRVDFMSAISWMRPGILALGADAVWGYVKADTSLGIYRSYLDNILRYAPHTLSAAEEKVASEAALMEDGAGNAYNTFANSDLPYPEVTLSTGEKVRLDAQGYTKYRASPNRADRDLVFRAFWGRYKEYERTCGTTLDAHIKTHLFNMRVHKFTSSLEAATFASNIPVAVYERLIADVHANLPTLHRYLRLRQRMMGVDQLRYEDLYASIVKSADLEFTPEQAQELVLGAVAPLGTEYVDIMRKGYQERWVDWMPTTGKQSGAYSDGVYGVHPYQLLNFTGTYEEVLTLAHEWGHSMQTYLSDRKQPYPSHDYATFVAEVASTLNENLLLHHMLGRTKDRDTRLFLLGSYLDGLRTTLFRQTLFAEFELRAHQMAEKGEPITGEKLTELYRGLVKTYYGDAQNVCKVDDLYGIEWAYIRHFYFNFYVYQYATSVTASANLAANMRADAKRKSNKSRDAYLNMLAAGSSKYPIELLKDAGVDMTTSKPFQAAMAEMNAIMDEMEKLLK
jgi:oligoendopeptidase F